MVAPDDPRLTHVVDELGHLQEVQRAHLQEVPKIRSHIMLTTIHRPANVHQNKSEKLFIHITSTNCHIVVYKGANYLRVLLTM